MWQVTHFQHATNCYFGWCNEDNLGFIISSGFFFVFFLLVYFNTEEGLRSRRHTKHLVLGLVFGRATEFCSELLGLNPSNLKAFFSLSM